MKHFFSLRRGCPMALLVLLWLAGPAVWAQAPAWQAAMSLSDATFTYDGVRGMTTDASGNVYLAGTFAGSISFGNTTLNSDGILEDVFVAKWNPTRRTFEWAVRAGGPGIDIAAGIAVTGTNVYVIGSYYQGSSTFGSTTLPNGGGFDGFVAKLTDAGSTARFVWAQAISSASSNAVPWAVAATGTEVYLTGNFRGPTVQFGSLSLVNANSGTGLAATSDVFVAKLADLGTTASFTWAQRAGGLGNDLGQDIAVSGANVYLSGTFTAMAAFGSSTLAATGWQPGGTQYNDLFVAKLVDAGSAAAFAWAQGAGGTLDDAASTLKVSGANIYLGGSFTGTVAFGSVTLTSPNPPNPTFAAPDAFVAKLVDTGSTARFVWARQAGGTGSDNVYGLAVSGTSVYAVGYVEDTATFGSTTLVGTGSFDAFATQLTDLGSSATFDWVQRAGGTGTDIATVVAVSGNTLHVLGSAVPPATFGNVVLTPRGWASVAFLASLTAPILTGATAAKVDLRFSLAPNPARSAAFVQLPAVPGATSATLMLTDALGRTLRTEAVTLPAAGRRHELNLRNLAPGLYLVQVSAGNSVGTQRLVVE